MPTNKDFKRLVRARMEKTGEAYTAARANLLKRSPAPSITAPAVVDEPVGRGFSPGAPVAEKPDYAKIAGMSDAAIKKATGCDWEKWVFCLDHVGAHEWSHRAITDYVHTTWKVKDWWTQMLTVGYERIKGLRAKGQRRDGGFEANKSRTLNASAAAVFKAFAHARVRKHWLPGVNVTVKRATPNRSIRMRWDDGTPVEVWIVPKGTKKTAAQIQHRKLVDKDDADRRKHYWDGRLTALAKVLQA
ncbi:MAG TPA: hypothetical protein VN700_11855 [Vicinamibacterales bacterium]|nr:hypothetical protein [Vicinamibacterales bacterium]